MARKVIGMARTVAGWRRRWLLSLVILVGAGLALIPVLQAVHDVGLFELDRNAISDGVVPGEDWDLVFAGTDTASASVHIRDGIETVKGLIDQTIFFQGGSKDDNNTTQWKHTGGSSPDKDELLDAYAARYGDILYFGADRTANNGDAVMGFWFFQQEVVPQPGGTFGPGQHEDGDILVLSDFTGGGSNVTIRVFQWNGPGGSIPGQGAINGTLDLIAGILDPPTPADCVGPPSVPNGDNFCATVNNAPETSPWPFVPKVGNAGEFAVGEFYEGGIDLAFLNLEDQCFSSFLAETRSSTSITAQLKDFVGGSFQPCESGLVTTPKDGAGAAIPNGGLSIGSGSVAVTDSALLTITGVNTWTGTLNFFLCGPIATGTCDGTTNVGLQIGTGITVDNPTPPGPLTQLSAAATVTSVGRYCWRGEFDSGTEGVPDATDAGENECFVVNPVIPGITTDIGSPGPNDPVPLGTTLIDNASVSPTANSPGTNGPNATYPTINASNGAAAGGTVTFNVYGPNDATCSTVVATETVPLVGGSTAVSTGFTPTAAGTYIFRATYSGDLPNTTGPVTNGCGDNYEVVVVNPNQPGITTNASADPPGGVPVGTAIFDVATLSGTAAPSNGVHGKITFNAYGPFANTTTCTGAAVYTSEITITGDGSYNSADGTGGVFTPTSPGNYNWIASYTPAAGDVNNLPDSGVCGEENEGSLVIKLTPVVATAQFFYPNDSATIKVVSGGDNLAGTVQFRAWLTADCSGTPLVDQTRTIATDKLPGGTGIQETVETTNTTIRVSGDVTIKWWVDYTSTNPAHNSVTGTCGMEQAVIDVTDLAFPVP